MVLNLFTIGVRRSARYTAYKSLEGVRYQSKISVISPRKTEENSCTRQSYKPPVNQSWLFFLLFFPKKIFYSLSSCTCLLLTRLVYRNRHTVPTAEEWFPKVVLDQKPSERICDFHHSIEFAKLIVCSVVHLVYLVSTKDVTPSPSVHHRTLLMRSSSDFDLGRISDTKS